MIRVFVASPFSGDIGRNRTYLLDALRDSLNRGEAPFAPHALYPSVLDDGVPAQRAQGMGAGRAWLASADLVAVYDDHGISTGMALEIEHAHRLGIKVEHRQLRSWRSWRGQ